MDDWQLSELVGRHSCLYHPKNMDYKEQNKKDNAWKEIASVLKQSVDDCKKRWKNIRDIYNRRKRTGKLPTGSATKAKGSRWYLQEMLSFLDIVEYERKSTSNVPSSNALDISCDEGDINTTHEDGENEPSGYAQNEEETPSEGNPLPKDECTSGLNENPHKRPASTSQLNYPKRQKPADKILDIIERNSTARSDRFAMLLNAVETHKNIEEHPIDAFFKSMAMSVKQLSLSSQIKAKMEICRIVGELELMELQRSSSSTSVSSQVPSRPSTSFSIHSVSSPETLTNINEYQFSAKTQHPPQSTTLPLESDCSLETNAKTPHVHNNYSIQSEPTYFNFT